MRTTNSFNSINKDQAPAVTFQSSKSSSVNPSTLAEILASQSYIPSHIKHDSNSSLTNFKGSSASHLSKSFLVENYSKRPPTELIAIEIPLAPPVPFPLPDPPAEPTPRSPVHSWTSTPLNASFNSFHVERAPPSPIAYTKIASQSQSTFSRSPLSRSAQTDSSPLFTLIRQSKVITFDNLLELIFLECSKSQKKEGCFGVNRKKKLKDNEKLEVFFFTLGLAGFDINKVIHRSLIKKYFFEVMGSEELPRVSEWGKFGFPEDLQGFFEQNGAPMAFIIAIHVVEMTKKEFLDRIFRLDVPFLDICSQLAMEAYQISKLSKMKAGLFAKNLVPNYFKLITAGVLNFYMTKLCRRIGNYELLQQIVVQMRENHQFLMDSVDFSILKPRNLNGSIPS